MTAWLITIFAAVLVLAAAVSGLAWVGRVLMAALVAILDALDRRWSSRRWGPP